MCSLDFDSIKITLNYLIAAPGIQENYFCHAEFAKGAHSLTINAD